METKLSVLYVEDDTLTRLYFSRMLAKHFERYFGAADGLEGFRLYREHKPDIVITDLTLPIMDGNEMIQEIQRINPYQKIIITSGSNNAINFGENCVWLMKPIAFNVILQHIYKLCDS